MNYLLSYNRSGNTWLRFLLEYFTGRPTVGHSPFSIADRSKKKGLITLNHVDRNAVPLIHKRHELTEPINSNDSIILLLRNPRDCIWVSMQQQYRLFEPALQQYLSLLEAYRHHSGNKHLIYYEDLIADPISCLQQVLEFLGYNHFLYGPQGEVSSPSNLFVRLHQISLELYDNPVYTRGVKQNTFTAEELEYIEQVLNRYHQPELNRYRS